MRKQFDDEEYNLYLRKLIDINTEYIERLEHGIVDTEEIMVGLMLTNILIHCIKNIAIFNETRYNKIMHLVDILYNK